MTFAKTRRRQNTISTLNPALIQSSDYLDLSHRMSLSPHFHESRPDTVAMIYYDYLSADPRRRKIPFPSQTAGFLYYHRDRRAAPLEGSIRFRVAWSKMPSTFSHGQDLLLPSGSPWQILLPHIACHGQHIRLRDQLLHENLVTEEQLAQCRSLFGNNHRTGSHRVIFQLTQEFPVSFDSGIYLCLVGDTLHELEFDRIFYGFVGKERTRMAPWTGSAIVRFEPSRLVRYAGRRVVHLRVVKIINRLSCTFPNRILRPMEREFLDVIYYDNDPEPWAYDIDSKNTPAAAGLRALWDRSVK
ncbi:hypothetical protein B0H13DRAFT_1631669 [Mycena leptocephala]|nr:hypothetical protein B0H13DRAFT_1631669 [Mycena leptocephala]